MKKLLIGSFVGAIILFLWQFLSWGPLGVHNSYYKYSPKEDSILRYLSTQFSEDTHVMLPGLNPSLSEEENAKKWENNKGKPWAFITYHAQFEENMTQSMIRGFLVDFVIVLLLIWILGKMSDLSFRDVFTSCLGLGLIIWCFTSYMGEIWFKTPSSIVRADLIEALAAFGLLGVWLGFWLRKN